MSAPGAGTGNEPSLSRVRRAEACSLTTGRGHADCPFCDRIAKGEFDYEDSRCVAFEPLNPVTPGHFLAVPRVHVANALASPLQAGYAMTFAGELARLMELDAFNLITSSGSAATQTVFHLHVHVIPRKEGDSLALPWTGQKPAALDDLGAPREPREAMAETRRISTIAREMHRSFERGPDGWWHARAGTRVIRHWGEQIGPSGAPEDAQGPAPDRPGGDPG